MGQYYRIFTCEKEGNNPKVYVSYDYDAGAKLMEHSYYHNEFVEAVTSQLLLTQERDEPLRVWWVGDYANEEDIPECKKKYSPINSAWGDESKIWHIKEWSYSFDFEAQSYLINLDTHEYIDLQKAKTQNMVPGWSGSIHPLPLLTAVGNGRGGGDYCEGSTNMNMVGAWAGDLLQIVDTVPEDAEFSYIDITSDVLFREKE